MDNIDVCGLDKRLQSEVERVGILSARKLIELNPTEYQKLGNFSIKNLDEIKTLAADKLLPYKFKTAKEAEVIYRNKWKRLILDCDALDLLLGGGLLVRGITELSGKSGIGKTQICLQLSITVQYPEEHGGLDGCAIYICTEDRFPSVRLQQMLSHFPRKNLCKIKMKDHNFADNILIDHISDTEALNECLFKRLPAFIKNSKRKVSLIVIDSIAAIFRSDYALHEITNRANDMRRIGLHLHKLADLYNIVIVCVNQVTDVCDSSGITIPALGLAWANLVTTKLLVHNNGGDEKIRTLSIISAPHLPPAKGNFIIAENGVQSI